MIDIPLIGISPKNKIELPKLLNEKYSINTLSQGHSHFILLGDDEFKLEWGDETKIKMKFAERIISGRKGSYYKSKMVGIILENIANCEGEIIYFLKNNLPLILLNDSFTTSHLKKLLIEENIKGANESNYSN